MSVIGRMDEQVEAVLISPVEKRRAEPEQSEQSPARAAEEVNTHALEQSSSTQEGDNRPRTGLPVWLL